MNEKTPIPSGRYRHFKGNEYTVVGTARHSETLEEHVVYRQEYGDNGLWVRPRQMFSESVTVDGQEVPRFPPLGSSSGRLGTASRISSTNSPSICPRRLSRHSFMPTTCVSNGSFPTATPHQRTSGMTSRSMSG